MSEEFKLAMPIGSKWGGYNHVAGVELQERRVYSHGQRGVIFINDAGMTTALPYPLASQWKLDAMGHIRIAVNDALCLSFGPAE